MYLRAKAITHDRKRVRGQDSGGRRPVKSQGSHGGVLTSGLAVAVPLLGKPRCRPRGRVRQEEGPDSGFASQFAELDRVRVQRGRHGRRSDSDGRRQVVTVLWCRRAVGVDRATRPVWGTEPSWLG